MFAEQTNDWFNRQQHNIEDAVKRIAKLRKQYNENIENGMKLESEQGQKWNNALVEADKKLFEMKQKYWEEQNKKDKESLEYAKAQTQSVLEVKQAHFDLTQTIREERKELKKQYETARDSIPYLTEAQKETMFSEADYKESMDKLDSIEKKATKLYNDYLDKISNTSEEEVYLLDSITKEYKNQSALLEKEYTTTKAQLAVNKAQKELENAKIANKNVAILQNGQWTWTYDYETVKQAMEKVADTEYDLETAQRQYSFQGETTDLTTYINSVEAQIATIDNMVYKLDEVAKEVHKLTDALRNALPKFASGGVNTTTGAAIMHGTQSNPEVVFNSAAASRLYSFVENTPDISSYIADSIVGQLNTSVSKSFQANNPVPAVQPANDNRVYIGNIEVPEQYADQFLSLLRSMMSLY